MAKYSLEFKLELINRYLNKEHLPRIKGAKEITLIRYAQSCAKIYKEYFSQTNLFTINQNILNMYVY